MLNLNLLPPEEKRNMALIISRRAVIYVGGGFTAIFVIFLILLLPTIFMQIAEKSGLLRVVRIEHERQEKTGSGQQAVGIKNINKLTEKILGYNERRQQVFPLFEGIIREVPPSVEIESMRLHTTPGEITISGLSGTREDLLKFIDALGKNPNIEKIYSPVTNLIKERNVRFFLTAKLK